MDISLYSRRYGKLILDFKKLGSPLFHVREAVTALLTNKAAEQGITHSFNVHHIGSRTFVTLHGQVGLNVDNNLVTITKRIFSEVCEASRLRDFEVGSTWDEVGLLGEGHEGLDVGDKVRI